SPTRNTRRFYRRRIGKSARNADAALVLEPCTVTPAESSSCFLSRTGMFSVMWRPVNVPSVENDMSHSASAEAGLMLLLAPLQTSIQPHPVKPIAALQR